MTRNNMDDDQVNQGSTLTRRSDAGLLRLPGRDVAGLMLAADMVVPTRTNDAPGGAALARGPADRCVV